MARLHEDHARRLRSVQQALSRHGCDALLVTPGADLRYLTGYDALPLERLTCLVVPAVGDATLIVPRLERPAAEAASHTGVTGRVVDYPDGAAPYPLVVRALDGQSTVVAVGERMWAGHLLHLQEAVPRARWVYAAPVVAESRTRKSAAEVAAPAPTSWSFEHQPGGPAAATAATAATARGDPFRQVAVVAPCRVSV